MNTNFTPKTAFEGWVKKAIEELERRIEEHSKFANLRWENHLRHHEILEARLLKWGIALVGLSAFVGWIIRGFVK